MPPAAITSLACRARPAGRAAPGWTIMEMLVVCTVFSMIMVMMMEFQIETLKNLTITQEKSDINRDMRTITSQMSNEARTANFFVLYKDYVSTDYATPSQELLQGNAGDFVVFVYYGSSNSTAYFNVCPISAANLHPRNSKHQRPYRLLPFALHHDRRHVRQHLLPTRPPLRPHFQQQHDHARRHHGHGHHPGQLLPRIH